MVIEISSYKMLIFDNWEKLESLSYNYDLSSHIIERVKSIKDIGVTVYGFRIIF